jgi:hypothetical protein
MRDYQQHESANKTDCLPSFLAVNCAILAGLMQTIVEHPLRQLETHAMLSLVSLVLRLIPRNIQYVVPDV